MELTTEIEEAPAGERGQSLGELNAWASRLIDRGEKVKDVTAVTTGRRSELDGLRGVACLAVVANHALSGVYPHERGLLPSWGQHGGLVGVQLFLVLSGYLITGILMRGPVDLPAFYRRRFSRLYPTLLVVVSVTVVWSGDIWSAVRALTYTENLSMFPAGGSMLSHSWSLAVEEQFYLVWPVLLVLARRHAAKVAAVGIGMTWLAQSFAGWSEHSVYVGLRWDAVLAGCLLALVEWRGSARWFTVGAIVLGLGAVGADLGYPVLTVASVLMVSSAVPALGALRHVGRISYALYLWHVVCLRLDVPAPVAVALSVVLAEATYALVDRKAQRLLPPVLDRHDGLLVVRSLVSESGRAGVGAPPRLDRHQAPGDVAAHDRVEHAH